ncbi:MAG: hypothetical protein AAF551_07055 [Bacteroidota bacterium]
MITAIAFAQPPAGQGGDRRGPQGGDQSGERMSPEERLEKEKTSVMNIKDLSDKQKSDLEKIYGDFSKAALKNLEENQGDRRAVMEGMAPIIKEKDEKVIAILDGKQWYQYKQLTQNRRGGQGRKGKRGN